MLSQSTTHRNFTWLMLIITASLLSGCFHTRTKDGPPNFYVDETRIPNAVPKLEPLSRAGNMDHYTVFGKRYNIMRSSRNYEETGVASWYGTKFHTHHTSNGERYNMLAMTAAHKTLPLPTYVEVTNLKNGKKIIVKINDRGPFESNRLIDLSYVAAKKIGMIGHGTTYVNVKAIDPRDALQQPELLVKRNNTFDYNQHDLNPNRFTETHTPNRPIANTHSLYYASRVQPKHHYLQVGSFQKRMSAEQLKKRLASLKIAPVNVQTAPHAFHVQIGPFDDFASAERTNKRLKTMGLNSKRI